MRTIPGCGNWQLVFRREAASVTILRAVTCDRIAVLPESIDGLPVTGLADRALAVPSPDAVGEEVQLCGPVPGGEYDNKGFEALILPRTLCSVGNYAFMDCRSMHTLRMYDNIESIGTTALLNCRALRRMEVIREREEQGRALADLVPWIPRELEVCITLPSGAEQHLLFPEFTEVYTENNSSHFMDYTIEGGGYPYHHVFTNRRLSVRDYDALWADYLAGDHEDRDAMRLAWMRLRRPEGLARAAADAYTAFLSQHPADIYSYVIQSRDPDGLALLLKLCPPDPATWELARSQSAACRFTAGTALLLEAGRTQSGHGTAKSFDLSF